MSFLSKVLFMKEMRRGETAGYGATYRFTRPSRIAILPVGYADGYPRALSNRARVLIRGRFCPVRGRVSMDSVIVDVTGVPAAREGDDAVFIGRQGARRIAAEEIARLAGTIPYEIVCGIGKGNARRYVDSKSSNER